MSDRLTTTERKAKQLASKAEDLAAIGDNEEATRCYAQACKLCPENSRYKLGLESMNYQKENMHHFMEKMAEQRASQKWEKASPDLQPEEITDASEHLCRASERGELPSIKGLLKDGDIINKWNEFRQGDSALHYAKNKETAELLLESGALVDAGRFSWTPLMAAVRFGRRDVVRVLLARGADAKRTVPRKEPGAGRNALFCATSGCHLAPDDRAEIVSVLLDAGADASVFELETEWTPLHDACLSGDEAVASLLLDAGANVNAASTRSMAFPVSRGYVTPVDVARGVGFERLAEALGVRGGTAFENLHAYAGPGGRI